MDHKIVSREEWIEARKTLLAKEKEWTRSRDRLSAERRALPWVSFIRTRWRSHAWYLRTTRHDAERAEREEQLDRLGETP
jgi:predicted dithiol-disulfide oxidoreductase (DUF899 family)